MNKNNNSSSAISSQMRNLSKKMDNLTTIAASPKRRKPKNPNRRQRATVTNPAQKAIQYPGSSMNNMIMSQAADTGLRRLRQKSRNGISDSGIAFLKCAFAPPDFQASSVSGVPDNYRGASLTKKHRSVGSFNFNVLNDYYFLLAPSPGVAYYLATTLAGVAPTATTVWNAVPYSDFASMFGTSSNNAANQVDKYRFVSNHFEIIPTINQMTWSGSIQAWKNPVQMVTRQSGSGVTDLWSVTGLNGCTSTIANQYSGPFIMGIYTACYNSNTSFDFSSIVENITQLPTTVGPADFGQLVAPVDIPGLDNNFESMFIKVSGATTSQTALIKTWACVEYQVVPTSSLYEYQSLSPCDPVALELYREIIQNLPIGVPFEDNESFWVRVLQIINMISKGASVLPGPAGLFGSGVNMLSEAGLRWSGY